MAQSVAEGAKSVPSSLVEIKRVPETITEEHATHYGIKLKQIAPVASPEDLKKYDAILFGTPTRFGNMAAQMRNFLDQTGPLWVEGSLIGKIGSVFVSTGTGGGSETTITSFWHTLAHHGMIIMGVPYSVKELTNIDEVKGGSPYGAATLAGADGQRMPSVIEKNIAFAQGQHVAKLAQKLFG
jgi:NAD(P)H dehydrogenase (quinone)